MSISYLFGHKFKMPTRSKMDDHDTRPSTTTPLLSDSPSPSSPLSSPLPQPSPPPATLTPSSSPPTSPTWSDPLGAPSRPSTDEHLAMFRRAVGINSDLALTPRDNRTLEEGRLAATGIYADVLLQERRKRALHHALAGAVWTCHGAQVVLGAALTCLGVSGSGANSTSVTVLGAVNTVVAGFLALVKGKGLAERLGRTEGDFRQLRCWIEETESLIVLGVIGGDRREVGRLVQGCFERYNACTGRSSEMETEFDRGVDGFEVDFEDEEGDEEDYGLDVTRGYGSF